MKLSTTTELFRPYFRIDEQKIAEACRNAGFEALDFGLLGDAEAEHGAGWEDYYFSIRELCDSLGMEIFQTHLPFYDFMHKYNEKTEASIVKAIRVTQILGAKYAVLHPAKATSQGEDAFKASLEYYDKHCVHAAGCGVVILTENMPSLDYGTCDHRFFAGAEELIELADSAGVGICWDLGHPSVGSYNMDQCLDLRLAGNRIKAIHLNDNYGLMYDEHLPPYVGKIRWDKVMAALRETGYAGTLNFEVLPRYVPEYAINAFAKYLLTVGTNLAW